PDYKNFRNLALAYEALDKGGNAPCVLNAANEVAVQAFLEENIGFVEISLVVEKCLEMIDFVDKPNLEDLVNSDSVTRVAAIELIKSGF
ncbi:MAG: 1-deoxy-D-xylulose-5-phosphate reductoisomerase, partial [Bacteroidales bacterium]|nr:1-deoxy-D-xylulose-5-phosphate reductoisomerase [Bacteroidales bacterium]